MSAFLFPPHTWVSEMCRQSVPATLCLLVVLALVAPLPSGAVAATAHGTEAETDNRPAPRQGSNNSTLGESISSFMQVSTVETEGALDRGMWTAAYRRASSETTRARLVAQRLEALEARLDALEARLSEDAVANASAARPSSVVRAVVLAAETRSLRATVEATASVVGNDTDVTGLSTLRERVSSLDEPRVPTVPGAGVASERRSPRGASGSEQAETPGTASPGTASGPPRNASAENASAENASERPGTGDAALETGETPTASPAPDRSDDTVPDTPGDANGSQAGNASAPVAGTPGTENAGPGPENGNGNANGNGIGNASEGAEADSGDGNGNDDGPPTDVPTANGTDGGASGDGTESAPGTEAEAGPPGNGSDEGSEAGGGQDEGDADGSGSGPGNGAGPSNGTAGGGGDTGRPDR